MEACKHEEEEVEILCANGARLRIARAIFCAGASFDSLARQAGGSWVPMNLPSWVPMILPVLGE